MTGSFFGRESLEIPCFVLAVTKAIPYRCYFDLPSALLLGVYSNHPGTFFPCELVQESPVKG
jgi:hypothetical protein